MVNAFVPFSLSGPIVPGAKNDEKKHENGERMIFLRSLFFPPLFSPLIRLNFLRLVSVEKRWEKCGVCVCVRWIGNRVQYFSVFGTNCSSTVCMGKDYEPKSRFNSLINPRVWIILDFCGTVHCRLFHSVVAWVSLAILAFSFNIYMRKWSHNLLRHYIKHYWAFKEAQVAQPPTYMYTNQVYQHQHQKHFLISFSFFQYRTFSSCHERRKRERESRNTCGNGRKRTQSDLLVLCKSTAGPTYKKAAPVSLLKPLSRPGRQERDETERKNKSLDPLEKDGRQGKERGEFAIN